MADLPDLSSTQGRIEKLDPQLQITVRDHVHRILRGAIIAGRFAPDEKVNERQLAEQFGVSTTPIKEALRQLEAEGLVQALPRRGVIIRFNMGWAEEMILARAALESMIGHLAARRMSKEATTALRATVGLMEVATSSGDVDELIALNETFHDQIHQASRCQYLAKLIERQQFYDASIRRIIHSDTAEREKALREHAAIADAIIAGDAERAEKQMRDHVVRSGETYLAIVFGKREDIKGE
ncbi:GntR family transcriptional regulator [Rhizobium sp. CG4]|jgi:DNA-binding GntR family transcriptional regulator|uniref:GntR family transcriptional regulator n=1 Tax=Rhizobium/Agrobacterium group TaxID=227290 RepID=UPI00177CF86D|nr:MULTISPECIES: GntR family transcriptional regulator [Rhizobium/Agrobacterium group]MBD9388642.1 GntR family transcriptional regulator [Agrobacterium sp. AGB01]MCM2457379.1 GntR family transcriptional regulator [Rhizobium sp. CG4]MCS4244685.1 DNA-binding GntR family transcriptional regulator [Rhizobium sp. BIGb0125]MDO5897314.1 GntR family transcriptional regulator [Agrobacterium sp. Azo12]